MYFEFNDWDAVHGAAFRGNETLSYSYSLKSIKQLKVTFCNKNGKRLTFKAKI